MDNDLQTIIEKDDIESLTKIDICFSQAWTEKAVQFKAYKCLDYLLDKGTQLSQYCFLRAAENNDISFFIKYGRHLNSDTILYQVLETCYKDDFFPLFRTVVSMFHNKHNVIRKVSMYILVDPFLEFKENDYIAFLFNNVKDAIRMNQIFHRVDLIQGRHIGKQMLKKLIIGKVKLPLDKFRLPKRMHITCDMGNEHIETIEYYGKNVSFTGKFY